jgi:Ca-activated chloride channel family protein
MNSHLASKRSSFGVANLRNSTLLRAIHALNLNSLNRPDIGTLLRPDLFRGPLVVLVVALFQYPQDAMAFDWDDLWLTPNQQAKRLLESGQAQQAAELFADPQWQATARYRSGEFDKAAAQFAASHAAYNRANALARGGKLQAALDSYDEALAAQPNDKDAHLNRDLVRKLLEQEQEQEQQQQQSGEQEESKGEQGQGKKQSLQSQQQAGQQQPQNDQQPSQQDKGQQDESQRQTGRQRDSEERLSAQGDEQQDAQQQAKDDVAPQSADASVPKQEQPAQQQQPPRGDSLARATTEKELALEQWLRQVPDDPGGLLRRKFMLEHLQRRKESGTP